MMLGLRRSIVDASLLAALTFATYSAAAQEPPVSSEEQARRQAYERAHDAFAAGNFQVAHEIFSKLWKERPTYDIAGFLGQTELQLKRYRDAAEHISFSLRNWPPRERLELLARVREGLSLAKRHVGALRLSVQPPGARIAIDGRMAAVSPADFELYVEPGTHTLSVELEGHETVTRSLDVAAGQEQALELVLNEQNPRPEVSPIPTPAPPSAAPLPPPDASVERSRPSPAVLAFGGATILAATAAGAVFAINADSAAGDVTRLRGVVGRGGCNANNGSNRSDCADLLDAAESKDRNTNASYLMFGIATGAALFTAGYYFWPRGSQPAQKVGITWLPGGAFAAYGGTL
jgi:hypothetical protein